MDGLQGHAPPGRPTHRQTGITPLHIPQRTRRHACQTPEHQPHPRARTFTTGYPTPQPPATPTPDTLGHTTPPMDARGHAVHRLRQAVPLPHTHPAAGHHTGPAGEHRTPPTPRRLLPHTPLLLRPTPGQPPSTPTKTRTPTRPQTASPPHPIPPMVRTPLDPRPPNIHQLHLWPRGRRNLGPLQGVPPVPRTGHPQILEPNQHHHTARRMADAFPGKPNNSPPSSSRRRYWRRSAGDSSPQLSTPCYAPTRRTPKPRQRTCNRRQLPRQRSSSHTAPTGTCSKQQPYPKQTKPTSSKSCSTNRENVPHDTPTQDPHHAYTPSTEHNTGTAQTDTTGTTHTPTSMRAPPARVFPCHRPSTGTTSLQPPHVPPAYASGYHTRPYPATQTAGSA